MLPFLLIVRRKLLNYHSSIVYINIISTNTTTPNITASLLFSEKYRAAVAKAKTINCKIIRNEVDTGKEAFGAINVPQNMAIRSGVPNPNNSL